MLFGTNRKFVTWCKSCLTEPCVFFGSFYCWSRFVGRCLGRWPGCSLLLWTWSFQSGWSHRPSCVSSTQQNQFNSLIKANNTQLAYLYILLEAIRGHFLEVIYNDVYEYDTFLRCCFADNFFYVSHRKLLFS